jgi:hypothetical protein
VSDAIGHTGDDPKPVYVDGPPRAAGGGGGPSLVPPSISITVNSKNEHHLLSDNQLEALSELANDRSREWFLFFSASALGTAQNVWTIFDDVNSKDILPTPFDVFMSIVFSACLVGALIKGIEFYRSYPKLSAKIDEIRSRPKIILSNEQIQQATDLKR